MLAVGNRVADYLILDRLRSGGMATLYLARRTGASGFSKTVAIKVVHPHLAADDAFVRMFVDEALLSARIQHPNVVHVEELREVDGEYLLVMEYVPGCSLAQLLRAVAERGRRMTPELAVLIAIRVADGLHAAHETRGGDGQLLGVVHRDVSPQNVLLAHQGHVKLIDFGIARAGGRTLETSGSSLKGKLRYMSPEQAHGRAVDRRADVYALGLVLWEMLTLRRMFDGDNDLAMLDRVRNPPPAEPPSLLASGIRPALDRAVLHALEADPEQRPATAKHFRRELAEALPSALALDDAHLSELLAALLPEQMAEERERAADSASGVRGPRRREAVIETFAHDPPDVQGAATELRSPLPSPPSGVVPVVVPSPLPSPPSGVVPVVVPSPLPSPSPGPAPVVVPSPSPSPSPLPPSSGPAPAAVPPSPPPSPGPVPVVVPSPLPTPPSEAVPGAEAAPAAPEARELLDDPLAAALVGRPSGTARRVGIAAGATALLTLGALATWALVRAPVPPPGSPPPSRPLEARPSAPPEPLPPPVEAAVDAGPVAPAPSAGRAHDRRPAPRHVERAARPAHPRPPPPRPTKTRTRVPLAEQFGD